ncbi:hypothetical protein D3C81_269340 [compost metagenome]
MSLKSFTGLYGLAQSASNDLANRRQRIPPLPELRSRPGQGMTKRQPPILKCRRYTRSRAASSRNQVKSRKHKLPHALDPDIVPNDIHIGVSVSVHLLAFSSEGLDDANALQGIANQRIQAEDRPPLLIPAPSDFGPDGHRQHHHNRDRQKRE